MKRPDALPLYKPGERRAAAPRRFVVGGLLVCGETLLLIGAPKSGKSAIAVALASSIAAGAPFFGRRTRPGAVIYVAAERYDETDLRLEMAIRESPGIPLRLARARIGGDKDDVAALGAAMLQLAVETGHPPALFLLDTANALLRIHNGDENHVRDIGRLTLAIDRLREITGAAVALIHHSKRGESRSRGSEAFEGWADVVAIVEAKGDARRVRVIRSNTIDEGIKATFALTPVDLGEDSDTGERSAVVLASPIADDARATRPARLPRDVEAALAELHRLDPPTPLDDWRSAMAVVHADRKPGTRRQAFLYAKKRLLDEGLIEIASDESVSVRQASV